MTSQSHRPADTGVDERLRASVQRRTLIVVVLSQVLGGAGLAAGVTVGGLLAEDMLGTQSFAGAPTALFALGSALAAFLMGRLTQRRGRRIGLGLGFATGGIGAIGVVLAAVSDNVVLLFASLFIYGAGSATNLQARYAGTDLALPRQRGLAISIALVSTTFGAVAGPNLVDPLGELAERLSIPALAGPFLLAAVAYLAAGTVLFILLRPDPFLLARRMNAASRPPQAADERVAIPRPGPGAYVGATMMVLTQIAMVGIMTMTPVHMRGHHHGIGDVGLVISVHIGAMYLPSLITGVLIDRVGRTPMAIASAITLLMAGLTAAAAPGDALAPLILALALLGIGWNLGLISGTALVVDATVPENRARTQGTIDVLVALAGAGGGASSGIVMSATSYSTLALAGGGLALLFIPVLFWAQRERRELVPA